MKYLILILVLVSSNAMAYECLENIDLAIKANPNLDVKEYALTHFQCADKVVTQTPDVIELQSQDTDTNGGDND